MINTECNLNEQVSRMVQENQHFRVKSENDDITINLMREQWTTLANQVDNIRNKAASEVEKARNLAEAAVTEMMIERDRAVRSFKEIDTTLMQAADLIMQALRARQGDGTPEDMPEQLGRHMDDERLPALRLS